MELLKARLADIRTRIRAAAVRSGRDDRDIVLVAVSKTVDEQQVRNAYELGLRDFGENRVQELNRKRASVPEARWHLIGRLQTNKVKDVVGRAFLIHSLDRWPLAEEINMRGLAAGIQVPLLLQVNISGEDTKTGLSIDDVEPFLETVGELTACKIMGFMTMAIQSDEPEESRPVFRELALLRRRLAGRKFAQVDLKYLSMGMSQDYEVAVEEGANIVRIGSALFT